MQNFSEWFKNKAYYAKLARKKEDAINSIVRNAVSSGVTDLAAVKTMLRKHGMNLTLDQTSRLPIMINSAVEEKAFLNKEKSIKPKDDADYYSNLIGSPVSIKNPDRVGLTKEPKPPAYTQMKRVKPGLPTSHLIQTRVKDLMQKAPSVGHNVIGISRTDDDIMSLIDMES